jgi:hypothetical protein
MDERSDPSGSTFVVETVTCIWANLPMVLAGGIAFALFSVPSLALVVIGLPLLACTISVFTVAPAWSSLLSVEGALLENRVAGLVLMAQAFRRFATRSVRLGVVAAIPAALFFWSLTFLAQDEVPAPVWILLSASLFLGLGVFTLYLYAVPLMVLLDTDVATALRDGAVLASRYLGNTLGVLSMGILFVFGIYYISIALAFILPAIYGMFVVNNCRLVVAQEQDRHTGR